MQRINQYRNESDVIGQWREDCAVLGAAMTTGANAAYQSYKSWAEGNGMKPMSATKFGIRLADSNFHKTKTMKGAFYEGFGLVVQSA